MSHIEAVRNCESTMANSESALAYVRACFEDYSIKINQLFEDENTYGVIEETEVMIAKLEGNVHYIAEAVKRMSEELRKANKFLKKKQRA